MSTYTRKKIKDLKDGDYFTSFGSETSFQYEGGRFTRLWDAAYVDGFFAPFPEKEVVVIPHSRAIELAIAFRAL